jgi:hypothetical protein
MSLVNVAYNAVLTWSNPQIKQLERQALVPMFGEHPVELGLLEGAAFCPSCARILNTGTYSTARFPNLPSVSPSRT